MKLFRPNEDRIKLLDENLFALPQVQNDQTSEIARTGSNQYQFAVLNILTFLRILLFYLRLLNGLYCFKKSSEIGN